MRARAVAVGLVVAAAAAVVVGVVFLVRDDGDDTRPRVALTTTPASAPFVGLAETQIAVGGRCLRVVVADNETERVQGLRLRHDLGPYDGMLFVFDAPTEATFTMSTVPVPLDIGFYAADGAPISRRHMKPCPHAEAECPAYEAGAPFVYALETLGGKLPSGALSGCS
jgi:uncharacterized membrane protein (UPF0127 family)